MAAVQSPFLPSPTIMSAFGPSGDTAPIKESPTSASEYLVPNIQKSPPQGSPVDGYNPSPIASSNGTDFEDTADEPDLTSPKSVGNDALKVETKNTGPALDAEDTPPSAILAPLDKTKSRPQSYLGRVTPTPSQQSDITVVSPQEGKRNDFGTTSPPPISTEVPPTHDTYTTPRAQTREEAETDGEDESRDRQKSLEYTRSRLSREVTTQRSTPEQPFHDAYDMTTLQGFQASEEAERNAELATLRTALIECWTLCNTLAGLSQHHRKRTFNLGGPNRDGREEAFTSCWKLCKLLYRFWVEEQPSPVGPVLQLCRQFCQALFEVRQKEHEPADAVLRVSFELNNHLYNANDMAVPEPFQERTLEFYITLCHRLMKQRNRMNEESDNLLTAVWFLAEMLFSLRQNFRERKPADEEILGSAVQACWELCDLFREGWTQIRPDRGTPRPSQAPFGRSFHRPDDVKMISLDEVEEDANLFNPETPTTVFEDTGQLSPDGSSVPNIVILGPESKDRYPEWPPSASSSISTFSEAERRTEDSNSTIGASRRVPERSPSAYNADTEDYTEDETDDEDNTRNQDPRIACLKVLIVRSAMNLGFKRGGKYGSDEGRPPPTPGFNRSGSELVSFVKALPSNSFGSAQWQSDLLENYKQLVAQANTFQSAGVPRRASAKDVARSVQWMVGSGQYPWLTDLFRWVFGFRIEEANDRPGAVIQS